MRSKKLTSMILALALMAGIIPAHAAELSVPGDMSSTVTLAVAESEIPDPDIFSVTVPNELPLYMDADGNVTVGEGLKIKNQSGKAVQVTAISVDGQSGWTIADFSDDISERDPGTKELGLSFRGDTTRAGGAIVLTDGQWQIAGGSDLDLQVEAKLPRQSATTKTSIATVNWSLGWVDAETPFTITRENRGDVGYKGDPNEKLVIPATFEKDGTKYVVKAIDDNAFDGCTDLASVTIPASVTSIGKYAFQNCYSLVFVKIPTSVTSIGSGAFQCCGALKSSSSMSGTSFKIPDSVKSIGRFAFNGCESLSSVTLPSGVTSIGDGTFLGCIAITSIKIPNSVTSIGARAFDSCTNLHSVTLPNGMTSIGMCAFWCCTALTSAKIPNSVTSIEQDAFAECTSLEVTIPDSVANIGPWAFNNVPHIYYHGSASGEPWGAKYMD